MKSETLLSKTGGLWSLEPVSGELQCLTVTVSAAASDSLLVRYG